jgi:hypothetical protein
MGRRLSASLHPGRHVRSPVRAAVIVSVVIHASLGLILLRRQARVSAAPSDSIEVDFTVADVPGEMSPAPAGEFFAQEGLRPWPGEATKVGAGQGPKVPKTGEARSRAGDLPATQGEGEAQEGIVEAPAGGAADPADKGAVDRFASFRTSVPDFSRVPIPQGPDAKRDLLAAPRVPDKAPGDLPGRLRGPGGVTAQIEEDGQIHFKDPKSAAIDRHPFASGEKRTWGIGGPLDINDMLMHLAGQDPYASGKRKLADETREQRLCMARRAQHAREAKALLDLSTDVRAIAGREDWAPEKRRRAIFDIWDECDDDSDYAAMARATITAIIRQAFPEGSALAYQPQELLALNSERTSSNKFAPYLVQEPRKRTFRSEDCRPPDAGCPME